MQGEDAAFLQVAGEEYDTEPLQNTRNNGPAEEKEHKVESSTGALRGKKSGSKKTKLMKGKLLRFNGGCGEDLASLLLRKFDDNVPNTLPTVYSPLPHFLSNGDKESLVDIHAAPTQCSDVTFDRYDAVSPFLQAALMPQYISPSFF